MNNIEIFVASGSDLKEERQHTILIINKLGRAFKHLKLNLEIVEWETDLPSGSYNGKTIQEEIDPLLEQSDIVLVLFYSKLGKFTLHEYQLALQKKKKIFLYFKKGFSPENKTEHEQYGQVLDFKDEVEKENKVLFRQYNTVGEFEKFLKDDLTLYLLQEYGRKDEVLQRILRGSRAFYERLRGENGRFRMLHIEDLILSRTDTKDKWVPQPVSGGDEGYDKDETVITLLPRSWKQSRKHAVIVGEGGMGKTVSLVRLWESLLDRITNEKDEPVPVFIALNEFNQVKEENRRGFILNYVRENYCDSSTSIEEIWDAMKQPEPEGAFKPQMALLLDGFNEITVEKKELLLEIKRIMEQCPGTRIVLTSRFDMRGQYQWGNWNLVRLMKLEKAQVESYLQEKKLGIPGQARFLELMGNPMMLTLYATTCEVQNKNRESEHCCFKDRVESVGELLWNFMEAQVGNLGERLGEDREKVYYYKFLLKFFLPALGFEMEKAGLFDFTNAQINGHIDFICKYFSQADFFDTYPEFEGQAKNLPLGDYSNQLDRWERTAKLKRILCEELHVLVKEGESYRFLHQDFRDFFAAMHLLNEIEMGMADGGRIPEVIKELRSSVYVRRMMAEIEGEHYAKPYVVNGERWRCDIPKGNRLHGLVDCCRGKFGEEVGYAVWNVVSTWQEVRGELSGADLSRLDLSHVPLNRVICSRLCGGIGGRYLAAVFDGSRVHETNLFPQGHTEGVTSAVYSPAGDKILSASYDETIKEWDAATGECLRTLDGHTKGVNSSFYSPAGDKILSASDDHTVKEWDAAAGECLRTLEGHTNEVTSAVYSTSGDKILSASWDETVKEWDAATGECLRTLKGHTRGVNSAVYSPAGDKIVSASEDESVKEWNTATGECLRTLEGHIAAVRRAVYSPEGDKILSVSYEEVKEWDAPSGECLRTLEVDTDWVNSAVYSPEGDKILSMSYIEVKEWDASSGECLRTLAVHTDDVWSAVYSPAGDKILSASDDHTVKEWDAATGECLHTLAGYTDEVWSAVYSPAGDKILSASDDHTVKEWDAAAGECLRTLEGHAGYVNSAVYSPAGDKILSASEDGTVKEWDATTGECLRTLKGHMCGVTSAVYSPAGDKILSTSVDHTVKEWDAATGECLLTLEGHEDSVTSAVYSPAGDKILSASTDTTVKEWDAATGECLLTLEGHTAEITSAVYSPIGDKILSMSYFEVKEWDAATGECLHTLERYAGYLNSAVYSLSGDKILSASEDGTIKEWDAATWKCLKTHQIEDNPDLSEYHSQNTLNKKLPTDENKIFLPASTRNKESRTLLNIPGLWIQGCSFKNLEKNSQWSEEALELMKQYGARF